MSRQRGDVLVEFALAWPLAVLLTAGGVQLALWGGAEFAAHDAALAGARVGQSPAASVADVQQSALAVLRAGPEGGAAAAWCPGSPAPAPPLWVCAELSGGLAEARVGGGLPPLLPFVNGGSLPLSADVQLPRERFVG